MADRNDDGSYSASDGRTFLNESEADRYSASRAEGDLSGGLGSGGGGAGGGFGNIGGAAMAGAAILPIVIAMAIPMVISKILEFLVGFFCRIGIIGRILISVIMGTIFGLGIPIILSATPLFSKKVQAGIWGSMSWGMGAILVVVFFFALPTIWVYCSHYFTLKARFNNEGKGVFLIPVAVGVFGFAGVGLIHGIGGIVKFFSDGRNGWGMPGLIYWLPIIAGFIVYMVKNISVGKLAKEARKEEGLKPVGLLVALALTCVFPIILGIDDANDQAGKKQARSASLAGQKLTVETFTTDDTYNLRAEASGTSRLIRTLNKGEEVTATGELSGLWVPVKAGDDEGFVLASFLKAKGHEITGRFPFPFEATTSAPIQLYRQVIYKTEAAHTIPRGTVVTVLTSNLRRLEIKNQTYVITSEGTENFVPKFNDEGSFITHPARKPEGYPKDAPYEVLVTEAIEASNSSKSVSIPAGATVTVTGLQGDYGIWKAVVTYQGNEKLEIYWRYLQPKN
jgi:hypothetical protein